MIPNEIFLLNASEMLGGRETAHLQRSGDIGSVLQRKNAVAFYCRFCYCPLFISNSFLKYFFTYHYISGGKNGRYI